MSILIKYLYLRYSKTLISNFSEDQDEYNYIRQLNQELNINSKEDYINKKSQHRMYIPDPEDYFCKKGVWKNWYDYIGINTSEFIQSKDNWINFCKEKMVNSLDDYMKCCELDENLPKEPADFYKDFTNLMCELSQDRIRRK